MHQPLEESTSALAKLVQITGCSVNHTVLSDWLTDGSSLGIINHLFAQDAECGMAMSIQILGGAQRRPVALGKEDLTLQGGTH